MRFEQIAAWFRDIGRMRSKEAGIAELQRVAALAAMRYRELSDAGAKGFELRSGLPSPLNRKYDLGKLREALADPDEQSAIEERWSEAWWTLLQRFAIKNPTKVPGGIAAGGGEVDYEGPIWRGFGEDSAVAYPVRRWKEAARAGAAVAAILARYEASLSKAQGPPSQSATVPSSERPKRVPSPLEHMILARLHERGARSKEDIAGMTKERPTADWIARSVGKGTGGYIRTTLSKMKERGWIGNARGSGPSGGYYLLPAGIEVLRSVRGQSGLSPD